MRKNRQSTRSLIAFLVTWSFIILMVTGIVLYIVPQGRIAYWVHWSLAGLEKEQWGWVHMMFGGLFIVTGCIHLFFNWKPFKKFLADRVKGRLELKREVVIATGLTLAILLLSMFRLPPASWVIDLNEWVKASWVSSPELEPPFGHAEELSLAGLCRRMNIDLEGAMAALRNRGVAFDGKQESLEQIARRNGTTPMALYGIIRAHRIQVVQEPLALTPEAIEARYGGTGLGRKRMSEICETVGIDLQAALGRLSRAGIEADGEMIAKTLAERYDTSPMDLLKIMMLP